MIYPAPRGKEEKVDQDDNGVRDQHEAHIATRKTIGAVAEAGLSEDAKSTAIGFEERATARPTARLRRS